MWTILSTKTAKNPFLGLGALEGAKLLWKLRFLREPISRTGTDHDQSILSIPVIATKSGLQGKSLAPIELLSDSISYPNLQAQTSPSTVRHSLLDKLPADTLSAAFRHDYH